MPQETGVIALLEADKGETALQCLLAIQQGAVVATLEESLSLDQHLSWLQKHQGSLALLNLETDMTKLTQFLEDPLTRSVAFASVGLSDEALLPDRYYTVAVDPARHRLVSCLAVPRTQPRRAAR